ncbi:MAG: hypothetical protein E2O51_02230 [Gammaproteobacteria bacterium]|nr:MAG: hypothetical protein E2O55_03015 [Gammaproteobacteria bacterium]TDJ46775.1 MAG: hypothetical protein E2O51_02230 [Gammaproteobacteria bacterium]
MRRLTGFGFFLLPGLVLAHHSTAYFSDEIRQLEGVITEVQWRNPHIALMIDVTDAQGETEAWRLEANSIYNLLRSGVTKDLFRIGDRLEVTGRLSVRQERVLLTNGVILPSGESLVLWNNRRDSRGPELPDTVAENKGIFRVWSVPRPSGRSLHFPFTETAIAARASWNMLDNFAIRCEAEGMPRIMINPHPFEFTDLGSEITLRTELYDIVRTIHTDGSSPNADQALSHLGYSVGTWEGDTFVVMTTHINWPFFDNIGTPQSEDVQMVERYTLSEDQSRLNYVITITDPSTFTEPATITGQWLALGEILPIYDCKPYEL